MIGLIIWILIVALIAVALLGVAKAVLGLPAFAPYQPYANVVYAVIVLIVAQAWLGNEPFLGLQRPRLD